MLSLNGTLPAYLYENLRAENCDRQVERVVESEIICRTNHVALIPVQSNRKYRINSNAFRPQKCKCFAAKFLKGGTCSKRSSEFEAARKYLDPVVRREYRKTDSAGLVGNSSLFSISPGSRRKYKLLYWQTSVLPEQGQLS